MPPIGAAATRADDARSREAPAPSISISCASERLARARVGSAGCAGTTALSEGGSTSPCLTLPSVRWARRSGNISVVFAHVRLPVGLSVPTREPQWSCIANASPRALLSNILAPSAMVRSGSPPADVDVNSKPRIPWRDLRDPQRRRRRRNYRSVMRISTGPPDWGGTAADRSARYVARIWR